MVRCNNKTISKGKVCKSKDQIDKYFKDKKDKAYLSIILPNTYFDSNDY